MARYVACGELWGQIYGPYSCTTIAKGDAVERSELGFYTQRCEFFVSLDQPSFFYTSNVAWGSDPRNKDDAA